MFEAEKWQAENKIESDTSNLDWGNIKEYNKSIIVDNRLLILYKAQGNRLQSSSFIPVKESPYKCAFIDNCGNLVTSNDFLMQGFGKPWNRGDYNYFNRDEILIGLKATLPFVKDRKKFLSIYVSYVLRVDLKLYKEPIENLVDTWIQTLGDIPYTLDNRNTLKTKFDFIYEYDNDIVAKLNEDGYINVYICNSKEKYILDIKAGYNISEFINCVSGGNVRQLVYPLACLLDICIYSITGTDRVDTVEDAARAILDSICYVWFKDNCREEDDEDLYYDELNSKVFVSEEYLQLKSHDGIDTYLAKLYVYGDDEYNNSRALTRFLNNETLELVNKTPDRSHVLDGWCRGPE